VSEENTRGGPNAELGLAEDLNNTGYDVGEVDEVDLDEADENEDFAKSSL
jgi:hypothetical protein